MDRKMLLLMLLISFLFSSCSIITNADPSSLSIEGKVLVNHKLTNEEFIVQVYKENDNEPVDNSALDPDGSFEVNIKGDGNYIITVVNANGNDYKSNKISFSIENNQLTTAVDFTLIVMDERAEQTDNISTDSPPIITGTVTYPSGMNYVDITVMLTNKEGGKPLKVFMVDQHGEFHISDIDDGIYFLSSQGPDNTSSPSVTVEVVDNKVVGKEKIILELK